MLNRRSVIRALSSVTIFAVVAQASVCPNDYPERVEPGNWGGEHIGMVVSDTGAVIEYDCAAGAISVPLLLGSRGEFAWTGTHSPGRGGPVRVDEPPNIHPARYSGRVSGNNMTVTLTLDDNSQPPQSFTLVRGANASVFRCL